MKASYFKSQRETQMLRNLLSSWQKSAKSGKEMASQLFDALEAIIDRRSLSGALEQLKAMNDRYTNIVDEIEKITKIAKLRLST